jgi:hypothetical protein
MTETTISSFFTHRWQGNVPVRRLFWLDMLGTGTVVNLLFGFVALILLAKKTDPVWSMAVHWLAMPYNLFMVGALWRHRDAGRLHRTVGSAWLMVCVLI